MCIIVVKKAGIAAPSEEMVENMWNHNPDGAGCYAPRPDRFCT